MSELRDTMLLDLSQPIAEIEQLEKRFDNLFRPRTAPISFPAAPQQPSSPTAPRQDRRELDQQLERLTNRLRVVQGELQRLGDEATPKQLEVLERRLARLTTQAELLAPGLDQGGKAAAKLSGIFTGLLRASADVQEGLARVGAADGIKNGTQEVDAQIKSLAKSVSTVRGLWQTQILTDEQAGQSALHLRDRLLKLAASEDATADSVLKATQAAAAAQRVLDASNGQQTKGGFAYSASLGILDALGRVGGPVGAAAFTVGSMANSGLLGGLLAGKPKVGKGAQDIGDQVISSLKNRLEIRSPSRVTMKIGEDIAAGLTLGMKSGMGDVAKTSFNMGNTAVGGVAAGSAGGNKIGNKIGGAAGAFGVASSEAANGAAQFGKWALSAEQVAFVAGAATTAVVALGAAFAHSVTQASAFEDQMANIRAQTQPTAEELVQLKDAAMNIGTDIAVGPTEGAKAMLELNKAGLTAEQTIKGGLLGALNLAGAAGISAGEGANIAVGAMTAFNLASEKLPDVADTFANFANKTTLGATDLQQAIAAVGPVALSAGLQLNDFAGYMATLAQGGFKNMSDAGTSLKTMLLSLKAPSDTAKKAFKDLHFDAYNAAGQFKELPQILDEMRSKLKGLTEEKQNKYLKDIFGTDGIRAAEILLNRTPEAIQKNIAAMGLQGEAARVAKERFESLAGQGRILKAEWEKFSANIGLIFVPALTAVVKGARAVVEGGNAVFNGAKKIKEFMPEVATALYGVGLAYVYVRREAVATAAMNIWANMPTMLAAVRVGVLGIGSAIKTSVIPAIVSATQASLAFLAANPYLLLIAGATALALSIQKLYGDINNTYEQIDAANNASFEKTMARVQALRKEGGEYNNTQAAYLIALERLKQAQEGTTTTNALGIRKTVVDDKEVEAAQAKVLALREEITRLNTERARRPAAGQPVGDIDPEKLKKQTDALKELRSSLSDKAFELRISGMSELGQQIAKLGKDFLDLRLKIKAAFDFDNTNPELLKALGELDAAQQQQQSALLKKGLDDQLKLRQDHEKAVRAAEAAAAGDSLAQRRNELNQQIADLKATYSKEISEALQNGQNKSIASADRQKFIAEAGRLQQLQNREVLALERQRDQELERMAQERLAKTQAAQRELLSAQAKTMSASISLIEQQRDRELQMAGDVPEAKLAIERRYGPQLAAVRAEQQAISGAAERSALQASYEQQMRDAKTAGSQRGALEQAARATYLEGLRELELRQKAETDRQLLEQEDRIQKERLAIYKKALDERLAHLKEATGQEIAQLEKTLALERARAVALGEGDKVAAIDEGLKKIKDIKFENISTLKEKLKDGLQSLGELRTKLADLNPNKDPRQEALSKAANPYNSLIADAKKQQQALQEAYAKLTPDQQRDQGGAYLRQQRQLSALLLDVGRQRNVALQVADAEFNRKRENEAQQSALKLAKTEYDRTRDSGAYLLALDQDKAFWQARLKLAKEGSQQQQEAEQRLSENEGVRKAVLESDKQLIEQRRQMSRDELQSALDLARTDADRARARAQLLQVDRDRLAALPAEIAASEKTVGNEDKTNALKREQLALRKSLLQAADEEVQRSDELLSSQLKLQVAQHALVAARAVTNAQVVSAKQQSIADTQAEADQIARLLDTAEQRGLTALQIDDKKVELLGKQTSIYQQQVALHDYLKSLGQESLALLESQIKLQNTLTGGINDPEQAKQSEIESVRRQLALNAANIQNAKNQEEVNQLQIERNGLLADEIVKQRELAALSLQRRQSEVALQEARGKLNLQLNGMANDAVSMARADLDISRNKFQLTQSELKLAQQRGAGITEINGLLARQAEEQAEILKNVQKLAEAEKSRIELAEQLAQAHIRVMRAIRGQGTDSGEISQRLELNLEQRIDAFNDSVEKSLGKIREAQKNIAKIARDKATFEANHPNFNYLNQWNEDTYSLVLSIRQDNRIFQEKLSLAVGELGKQVSEELRTKIRSNLAEQRQAEAQHIGTIVLPALQKELDARSALADATIKYGEAVVEFNRVPFNTDNAERLKSSTEALTSALEAHKASLKGLADGYRNAVTEMDGVRDASERLKKAAYQGNDPFQSAKELDRLTAIAARRDAAQARLREAIGSNDVARIKRATLDLAQQQERYNAQADKLEKNGVGITRDDNAATRQLSDQVDALGIQYDRDSINLDKRAEQLDREAETVTAFGSYVNEFQETVNRLVEQRGDRYVDGNWIKSADVEKYLDGLKIVNSQASVAYAAPNTQGATSQAVTAAAVQAAINASVNSAKQEAVKSPTAVSGGQTSTITNVFNFSIPVTVDGAPVPTPQEFRAIAQEVFQQGVGSAVRNKDWLGGHCDK